MTSATDTAPAPRAGRREWLGLAVLVLPTLLLAIDLTVLHLALPHLAADLRPSAAQQLWILDVYGFMVAGFLVTMGTLGDRVGRRRLLLIGAVCFGVASVLAAYSTGPGTLIVTRAVLGVAGATLMPSTLSLIRHMFPHDGQRRTAIAVWTAALMGGVALGPVLGGMILQWFWWGAVFLMGVPIMLVLLVAGPLLLPESRAPHAGRLDALSVVLSLPAVLAVVYALKAAASDGWGPTPGLVLAGGAGLGWLFVRRQRTLTDPLVDPALFRQRVFTVGLGSQLLGTICLSAFMLLFAQYLQLVRGFGPVESGVWMMPYALATVAGLLCTPAVAARLGDARAIAGGLLLAALGFTLLALTPIDAAPAWGVVSAVLIGLGAAPLMVLITALVIAQAPPEKSGSAASLAETGQELGAALGIATLGTVSTAVYRHAIDGGLPPGVPARAAEEAETSLASAASAAEGLPAGTADALMDAARDAFGTGISLVAAVAAALLLALACATAYFLRTGDRSHHPRTAEDIGHRARPGGPTT
ncbi:MFS transporter [Streptomyces sp. NBC_01511]|uniref:MFS transporter n=1 Tax=Streptomyces sp. NBC_01511 TaxID=2903889 RepID=UPI00386C543B